MLAFVMARLAPRLGWPTLRVLRRLPGRGCLPSAWFPPLPEVWHWMPKHSCSEVRDYRNAGSRVKRILLVCFSEFIFCLPLCKISKAVCLNTWRFLFVFSLCWFSFPRAIFLSINDNKEESQGLQCRWSARMILSSCVNRVLSLLK